MLSTPDIAAMRSTISDSLPDTAAIGRYTATPDGAGGVSVSYPVAAADAAVACRISPVSTSLRMTELLVAEREISESNWVVTFGYDVSMSEKDRLTIGAFTYEVAAVFAQSSWSIDVRVLCRLVQ